VPCGASPPRPRVRVGSIADPAPRSFTFRTDFEGTGSPVVPRLGGGHGGSPLGVPAHSLKRAGGGDRLWPPDWACDARLRPDGARETDGGMPAVRAMRDSPRRARSRSTTFGRWAPPIRGRERMTKDLEGEQSPWEERATRRWKRRWVATDSSTEQCPEVGCSAGAAPKADAGNGIHPRSHPSSAKRPRRGPRVRSGSLGLRRPLVGPGSLRRLVFQHGMAPSGTPPRQEEPGFRLARDSGAWSRSVGHLGDLRSVSSDEVGVRLGESERHRTGATDFCTGSYRCRTGLGRCEEIEW
jgi:hypothetical protein